MIMHLRWTTTVLLVVAIPACLQAVRQDATCSRIPLEPSPDWTNSAAWNENGKELIIVDYIGGRLLRYMNGKYSGTVARPGMGELEFNQPASLAALPGGYLLENIPGKLIWLDSEFRPVKAADLLKLKPTHLVGKIESFDWEYPRLIGNQLLGFAVLHRDDQVWQGFVQATLKPFELTNLVEEIDHKSPENMLFRLQGSQVVVAGSAAYVLRWAQPTYLLQISPQKRRLRAFPSGFDALPNLPQGVGGMAGGPILFKALEHSTSAVRLYGLGDFLYLLTRKPAGSETLWQLWQIDPRRDVVVRSMTLPTRAHHVLLAPGPIHWALIEKGPVIQSTVQDIHSMLFLPASWIEDPTSKVLADGNKVSCP